MGCVVVAWVMQHKAYRLRVDLLMGWPVMVAQWWHVQWQWVLVSMVIGVGVRWQLVLVFYFSGFDFNSSSVILVGSGGMI